MSLTTALSAEHYEEIIVSSAITPEVAEARGYRTLTDTGEARDELADAGFSRQQIREESFPLLLIPMRGMDGGVRGYQIKPATPRTRMKDDQTRTPIKYETPFKAPLVVDVPGFTRQALQSETTPLWVTEGMKKTDALVSQGLAAVGLTGVFNWRNKQGVLGDWEEIPIKGRPVVLCFDADASSNRNVQLAMSRAGAWFKSRGASKVHYVVVPGRVGDTETKGVDDYFAAGGDVAGLHAAASERAPGTGEKDAAFTDAFLVEELAEAMAGRFCWASGLGWLKWTGRIWREVPDVEPLEAVRVWAAEQFDKALAEQGKDRSQNMGPKIQGWRAILAKSRLTALRDLAKGLLQRDAAEFDGDPDLLTCSNGTLHLPSATLLPFDPEHCITKSADAEYRRGYTHPSWTAILRAIPGDLHEWYQDRLGQALTGYPVPDHTLVIAHGSGANGKSALASVIRRMVGTYGVMISDRVLMANPDAHPTELMDLRGARYALMEETPEARHLNVQRLKTVLGTETIKARHIRQDTVEFLTSHSLFINTNYKPTVTETDWGTWRRLSLMPFPFTFKKPGTPLSSSWERTGDPMLAYASNDPEVRSAALAWMAEGAQAWYARGRMMLEHPERVERETREWRAETDLILGFADERLVFEREAFTQTRDMLSAFNEWVGERGHRPWNDRTFATRFGDHDTIKGAKVKQGRWSVAGKQQRGWSGAKLRKGDDPFTGEFDRGPVFDPEHGDWELENGPCGEVPGDGPACDWNPACKDHFPSPEDPSTNVQDRPESSKPQVRTPMILGFDLETASAGQLFIGAHEGPFVRLAGATAEDFGGGDPYVGPLSDQFIRQLNNADTIYGHNILGFDIPALAHHHGADYDALAAKAWDTQVAEVLVEPPLSKGMPKGHYALDGLAARYGVAGKTDDLKVLAKEHGGYDKIPVDSRKYQDYLRGDLAATKAVYEAQRARVEERGLSEYAEREMRVEALKNRMVFNGWAVDTELLTERREHEDNQRDEAIRILNEGYGVPLARPDTFKVKPKAEWPLSPEGFSYSFKDVLALRAEDPEETERRGLTVRIPGEPFTKPWSSGPGLEALEKAFNDAGAKHVPRSPAGQMLTSSDALGEGTWYCPVRKRAVKGMLHPDAYGDNAAVRAIVDVVAMATGARAKYAEVAPYVTAEGRVHPQIGQAQGSGRWAHVKPSTSTMGKRGAAAAERDIMIADPGHMMLTSDHSQLDIRTVAALSQDPELIAMLQPDSDDFHELMAEVYFGDRGRRHDGKPISHGTNYGQGWKAIAERNGLDPEMVRLALEAKGERFWVQGEWTARVRAQAEAGQLLDNGFGRPMRADPERAYTQAPALMGQGASRDVMCESLLRLDRLSEGRVRPFLRGVIHDEIVLSVPEGEVAEWQELLREAMTWEWRGVPILCDVSAPAFRWSECK